MILRIGGSHTSFVPGSSVVSFQPANAVFAFHPRVMNSETISMIIFIMPRWLTKPLPGSIEVTVTTGDEVVSGFLDVTVLPFLLGDDARGIKAE